MKIKQTVLALIIATTLALGASSIATDSENMAYREPPHSPPDHACQKIADHIPGDNPNAISAVGNSGDNWSWKLFQLSLSYDSNKCALAIYI